MEVWLVVESLREYVRTNCRDKFKALCPDPGTEAGRSYARLREARNAHVHHGAASRNLGAHAVTLSLALEEALMSEKS